MSNPPIYIESKPVDKDGNWSPEWRQIMSQQLAYTQQNIGPEGLAVPNLTYDQIVYLTTTPNSLANGIMVYDTTNNLLKVIIGGAVMTVTTT